MKHLLSIFILIISFSSCKNHEEKKDISVAIKKEKELPEFVQELMNKADSDSSNISLKINLIDALDSLQFKEKALIELDKLITRDSLNNSYWLKRGQICKVLDDTANAIKAFHYAAKIYPTPIALMELANLYAETKNQKTISICKQLMKMNPDGKFDAEANFFMGVFYAKMNDNNNALKYFNLSIAKDFHFDDAYIEKGYLLYNNKNYDAALNVFKQLVAINQTSADGYYWLGKCFEALNNKSEAITNYNKAIVFNADLFEAKQAIERLSLKKN